MATCLVLAFKFNEPATPAELADLFPEVERAFVRDAHGQ